MNIKLISLLAFAAFTGITTHAQELSRKVPANAKFVVTINNKGILQNSSSELISTTLISLGAFEDSDNYSDQAIKKFIEMDLNLDKQAYVYLTNTDSANYTGILLPLRANHEIKEHMFSKFEELPTSNDYQRRVSGDGKTQVAWNQEFLLILTGEYNYAFFQQEGIANRYGLELDPHESEWASVAWEAEEAWEAEDTVPYAIDTTDLLETELEGIAEANEEESVMAAEEWEGSADSAQELEDWEYSEEIINESADIDYDYYEAETDSTYLLYQAREAKNDSIKNNLIAQWIAKDFDTYLDPENNLGQKKEIRITNQNTLVRLWLPNLGNLYRETLASYSLLRTIGVDLGQINYGYQNATFDFIQDKHNLKLESTVSLDKETATMFKAIYNNKLNKKFINYIPENYLAYASTNFSTEGYLQQIPVLMRNWYAPFAGENSEIISIAATALEIGLDEKSISKIMKGDQLFFLNNLQKVTKEYTGYDYDDDYNYQEVTKTKEEYQPNFLWMLTSEDQRLFKKIIDFAVKKEQVTLNNGIYSIDNTSNWGQVYVLFKDDIVFLASDFDQITAIKENRFKSARNAKIKKDILSNPLNIVVNTAAIPDLFNKLEIPVAEEWSQTVLDLSAYGDLQIKSSKFRKNQLSGEISLEFPKKEGNALEYILKNVFENLQDSNLIN